MPLLCNVSHLKSNFWNFAIIFRHDFQNLISFPNSAKHLTTHKVDNIHLKNDYVEG